MQPSKVCPNSPVDIGSGELVRLELMEYEPIDQYADYLLYSRFLAELPNTPWHLQTQAVLDGEVDRIGAPPVTHDESVLPESPLSLQDRL